MIDGFFIQTRQESHEHVTVSQYTDSTIIYLPRSLIDVLWSSSGQTGIHTQCTKSVLKIIVQHSSPGGVASSWHVTRTMHSYVGRWSSVAEGLGWSMHAAPVSGICMVFMQLSWLSLGILWH